jgi:hypothetical protein
MKKLKKLQINIIMWKLRAHENLLKKKAFLYLSYQVLWYTSKHPCWVDVSFFQGKNRWV